MKIFVGGLSYETRDEDLRAAFAAYGTPTSASVVTDRDTGRSRGFGFVEFASADEAKKAITAMDGKELQGRTLNVAEARSREGGGRRERW
jgi:RNA recognition motif-containing protein